MDPDIFHPAEIARYLGVSVHYDRLDQAYGYTDGTHTIWLDSRLTPARERVALVHELFHVVHGHTGKQPPHVEEHIQKLTARWLVPWHALTAAYANRMPPTEIADALRVTPDVLEDRVRYATPAELATLPGRTALCESQAA